MSGLTKEYFEQYIKENNKNLVTKEHFDESVAKLVTFTQLGAQLIILDKGLRAHAEGLQEELAEMVGDGFVDVISRLDIREKVNKLESRITWLEQQVGT